MRFSSFLVMLALIFAPAPLVAQAAQAPSPRPPVVREALEQRSPLAAVLRQREVLRLTPEQVVRLEAINQRMIEQNRPLVRQLLEIRSAPGAPPRVPPQQMTPEQREEWRRRVERARPIMQQIRENNHRAMQEVREVLTPAQREQLRETLHERGKTKHHHPGRRKGAPDGQPRQGAFRAPTS